MPNYNVYNTVSKHVVEFIWNEEKFMELTQDKKA